MMKSKSAVAMLLAAATMGLSSIAWAGTVSVTTGAGYVPMVKELAAAYRAKTGNTVVENYGGNVGQMLAQVEAGNGVNIVISDKGTLNKVKTNVKFTKFDKLGTTPLVFIWKKGANIKGPQDIATGKVASLAYPDPKATVYGRAAAAYLASSEGLKKAAAKKEMRIATVPQVFSYVAQGEVDAGFVNRLVVRKGAAKLGGSVEVKTGYPTIEMVAATVKGGKDAKDVKAFVSFLQSKDAKPILKKHGLE